MVLYVYNADCVIKANMSETNRKQTVHWRSAFCVLPLLTNKTTQPTAIDLVLVDKTFLN